MKTKELYDLEKTIAKDLLETKENPWEVLPEIKAYIIRLGNQLSLEKFDKKDEDIWIAKSVKVAKTAEIHGPCIIDENTEIRTGAFIRGGVIVGKNCVIGNSTELKNCILFDSVQVPHFNYIGDSILGYHSHLGAGAVTSNVKSDKTLVKIKDTVTQEVIETGLKKFGAMVGDFVEVGCNSVLCPGTIIGKNTNVYPLSMLRGIVAENKIYKDKEQLIRNDSREFLS